MLLLLYSTHQVRLDQYSRLPTDTLMLQVLLLSQNQSFALTASQCTRVGCHVSACVRDYI